MRYLTLLLLFPSMLLGQSSLEDIPVLFDKKQFKKAEVFLVNYVSENPKDIKGVELLGDAYGHQKKWDEAIEQYEQLVEANATNANYHYKHGGALGMKALTVSKLKALGIIGDVKKAFKRAAELDETHIDARWALVELYMQLPGIVGGSKKKSLYYANELQDLSAVDGYLAKGYIYEYDDEPELAENYYKKAIKVGGSLTCFGKLTTFYENENRPNDAISNIENAHKKHKRNALHYQIGKVCADYNVQLEKGEKCLLVFVENHSVKDGVPIEWAYYRLAQIYKHKKDKAQSLNWINKALSIRANFKQALKEKEQILQL
ncbi:tetratricopeptide repeat protein [Ichthyenterobacterium sp. W332]|uniref:Tetratricopeptide repeat protein n=1 Tax=Microcosmobacter mediterraneus TaxID=3075607 RepID=A0ABU2YJS6_9FLAO|nr:tetratricopeptide repeat protein [Ichthyenterobacterium sp. W332]MDT0558406.1 tetratricopeptide repeat protein [Ichthyenterobacterium sp. W332]